MTYAEWASKYPAQVPPAESAWNFQQRRIDAFRADGLETIRTLEKYARVAVSRWNELRETGDVSGALQHAQAVMGHISALAGIPAVFIAEVGNTEDDAPFPHEAAP